MLEKSALVITSISAPTPLLAGYAEESRRRGVDFIVVGDAKSPPGFDLDGCDFWGMERQGGLPFRLAGVLPPNHYARKNLGYLVAMRRGAGVIVETDDDNHPLPSFWSERRPVQEGSLLEDAGWVNVYRYFSDAPIWPRGLPLEEVRKPVPPLQGLKRREQYCPIQQGLADLNPDVDAVYRLTMPLPQSFSGGCDIVVGRGSWSPFNSQNTTWFRDAFPLLYIPSYCSFRMCDIWRSFVALRICWENGWGVRFHAPTVWQERNEHDLLKDFRDEVPGYLNNAIICRELAALDLKPGKENLGENLLDCYATLVRLGLVDEREMGLLEAWLADVASAPGELSRQAEASVPAGAYGEAPF